MNLCVVDVTPSYSIQANMQLTRTKTPSWIHSLRRHRSCLTFASAGQPGTSTVQDCRVVTRIGYSVIFRLVWWRSRVFMPVVNTCFYCRGWCFRLVPTASTEKIFHVRSCIQTTYCEDGCLCKVICYQIAQIACHTVIEGLAIPAICCALGAVWTWSVAASLAPPKRPWKGGVLRCVLPGCLQRSAAGICILSFPSMALTFEAWKALNSPASR